MALDPLILDRLHELLLPSLGEQATGLLITMLRDSDPDHPSHGLAALRAELDQRFTEVDRRFEQVDHRFELVEAKIDDLRNELLAAFRGELVAAVTVQTRSLLLGVLGAVVTMSGLAFALTRFA